MEAPKAPILYYPNFVENPTDALNTFLALEWERRGDTPRSEYYCNDFPKTYTYGKGKGQRMYLPRPWPPLLMEIRKKLEALAGCVFEVCFMNLYRDQSDQLGWHADDSPEMDDARPIATVSLGVEREIWFRPKPPDNALSGSLPKIVTNNEIAKLEKLLLQHGSAALMAPGMQDTWQHRIPKASFQCGTRISLTFRGYVSEPCAGLK